MLTFSFQDNKHLVIGVLGKVAQGLFLNRVAGQPIGDDDSSSTLTLTGFLMTSKTGDVF